MKCGRGFSIIEVLVGTAILSGVMMSLIYSTEVSDLNYGKAGTNFQCISNLNSGFSFITSLGVQSNIVNFVPTPTQLYAPNTLFTYGSPPSYGIPGISQTDLWSTASAPMIADNTTTPTTLDGEAMIDSAIRGLLAIYNSNAGYCTSATGMDYPSMDTYLNQKFTDIQGLTTTIRIQPYNLSTGQTTGCSPSPLQLYPGGLNTPMTNAFAGGEAQPNVNAQNNLGLLVTLYTTYKNTSGVTYNCSGQRKYSYQYNGNAPTLVVNQQYGSPDPSQTAAPANCSALNNANIQVQIGYTSTSKPNEKGVVFLCKDVSQEAVGTGSPSTTQCYGPSGPQPNGPVTLQAMPTNPNWVPCQDVTLCNVAPTASSILTSNNPQYIVNTYNKLPENCYMQISATAVDTAGNLPDVFGNLPNQFTTALTTTPLGTNQLKQPSCNPYCAVNGFGAWTGAQIAANPNGYYDCSGYFYMGALEPNCCIGSGCSPGNFSGPTPVFP